MIAKVNTTGMDIFVTNPNYAKARYPDAYFYESQRGWYVCTIEPLAKL